MQRRGGNGIAQRYFLHLHQVNSKKNTRRLGCSKEDILAFCTCRNQPPSLKFHSCSPFELPTSSSLATAALELSDWAVLPEARPMVGASYLGWSCPPAPRAEARRRRRRREVGVVPKHAKHGLHAGIRHRVHRRHAYKRGELCCRLHHGRSLSAHHQSLSRPKQLCAASMRGPQLNFYEGCNNSTCVMQQCQHRSRVTTTIVCISFQPYTFVSLLPF